MSQVEINICRRCGERSYTDYYGFCSVSCCLKYADEQDITFSMAQQMNNKDIIDELENRISALEYEIEKVSDELYFKEEQVDKLEDVIYKIKDLDWEKIKEERKAEKEYNESLIIRERNIKKKNNLLTKENKDLKEHNDLLFQQNHNLLKEIKRIMSLSYRFEIMDFKLYE